MLVFKTYLFITRRKKQYKNNTLKITAPTWNDELQLPHDSYPVLEIQYYIEYIIKKDETLTTIPPIHVDINRINNRLVFKIKMAISWNYNKQ